MPRFFPAWAFRPSGYCVLQRLDAQERTVESDIECLPRPRQYKPHWGRWSRRSPVIMALILAGPNNLSLKKATGTEPAAMKIGDIDGPAVLAFLDSLEQQRRNSVRSRNIRLAIPRCIYCYGENGVLRSGIVRPGLGIDADESGKNPPEGIAGEAESAQSARDVQYRRLNGTIQLSAERSV